MSVHDDAELARLTQLHREGLAANPLPRASTPASIEEGKKEFWDLFAMAVAGYQPGGYLQSLKLDE
jgi:hypothetical protein